jgi:hypothetical protein
MNRTNFEHAFYAVLMQAAIGLLTGDWLAGACFGAAFFLGREHAQREYQIGDPSNLPPWAAFDFWRWSLDSKLDLLFPVVAVCVVAAIMKIV